MKTNLTKETRSTNLGKQQTACAAPPTPPARRAPATGSGTATRLRAKHPSPVPTQPAQLIKLGVDVGLEKYAVCRQVDASLPDPPRMMRPEDFQQYALEQKALAKRVVFCYEAGFLGFTLARWAQAQHLECLVMAPVTLDERHQRVETDKLNARDICGRLDRYLAGNTRVITVCRVPTLEEETARSETRLREQLLDARNRLRAQGRSLLWQFGYLEQASQPWWQESTWEVVQKAVSATVAANLACLRAPLLTVDQQLKELLARLRRQATQAPKTPPAEPLPAGVGWLSMLILTREIMNWQRFKNRRQVACLTGLVPSESSTGQSRRQGAITKVGNPRVRTVLIEMVWRLVRFQPECHAVRAWLPILQDRRRGAAARKRAVVAAARVLAIDLWRLATHQTTAAKLGFV